MCNVILGVTASAAGALILITLWEILIGMWMNTLGQIVIMTPIYLKNFESVGADPITFGIIFILGAEIGFVTPPLGTSLFVAMPIAKVKLGETSLAAIPFIFAVLFCNSNYYRFSKNTVMTSRFGNGTGLIPIWQWSRLNEEWISLINI